MVWSDLKLVLGDFLYPAVVFVCFGAMLSLLSLVLIVLKAGRNAKLFVCSLTLLLAAATCAGAVTLEQKVFGDTTQPYLETDRLFVFEADWEFSKQHADSSYQRATKLVEFSAIFSTAFSLAALISLASARRTKRESSDPYWLMVLPIVAVTVSTITGTIFHLYQDPKQHVIERQTHDRLQFLVFALRDTSPPKHDRCTALYAAMKHFGPHRIVQEFPMATEYLVQCADVTLRKDFIEDPMFRIKLRQSDIHIQHPEVIDLLPNYFSALSNHYKPKAAQQGVPFSIAQLRSRASGCGGGHFGANASYLVSIKSLLLPYQQALVDFYVSMSLDDPKKANVGSIGNRDTQVKGTTAPARFQWWLLERRQANIATCYWEYLHKTTEDPPIVHISVTIPPYAQGEISVVTHSDSEDLSNCINNAVATLLPTPDWHNRLVTLKTNFVYLPPTDKPNTTQ